MKTALVPVLQVLKTKGVCIKPLAVLHENCLYVAVLQVLKSTGVCIKPGLVLHEHSTSSSDAGAYIKVQVFVSINQVLFCKAALVAVLQLLNHASACIKPGLVLNEKMTACTIGAGRWWETI